MRIAAALLMLLSLGACAEVTTFRRPDGSQYYHVNCGSSAKLESCQHAAERTCPGGFTLLNVPVSSLDPAGACAAANLERRKDAEPEVACPAPRGKNSFFVCK
jgi:hypothetical protein